MSTKGAEKDSIHSLNHLIISGNEEAALKLIQKLKETELNTVDSDGFAPIHWAVKTGSKNIFRALVKKGVNLYQQDGNGFVAYYYLKQHNSQKHVKLLEYYESNYPLELVPTADPLNQQLDTALQDSGLHTYFVLPQKNTTAKNYLRNLFAPAQLPVSKKRAQTLKPDPKKTLATLVSPAQLTDIAFGIIEELTPLEIITILNECYSQLDGTAKLACVYFIKELIRQDIASEWVNDTAFIKCYDEFLQNLDDTLASTAIRIYMRKLLGQTALAMAFDLTKAFSEAILRLTPQYFQASHMLKKAEDNEAFQALSALTNHLSEYVCMDILLNKTPEECAARYRFYIDVIQFCLAEQTNNYAAAFAIYNGLQFYPIQRLNSITSLILDDYQSKMRRFEELFHPSCKELRPLFQKQPHCVPVVAFYSKTKDTISQYEDFTMRVMMYGQLNAQFAKHCQYLRSLPHLSEHYRTDICAQLEKTTYNDKQACWYSFQFEPARVIKLESSLTKEDLEVSLKFCREVHSPIVINVGNKKHSGLAARQQIVEFARQQQWLEDTITTLSSLCDEATRLCDADMPDTIKPQVKRERKLVFKRPKLGVKTDIDALSNAIDKLNLETPRSSDEVEVRPRSRTVSTHHDRRKSEASNKKLKKEKAIPSSSSSFTPLADLRLSSRESDPATPEASAVSSASAAPVEGSSKGIFFK